MDFGSFERLVEQLMNPDNQARTQAEQIFGEAKKQQPDLVVTFLLQSVAQSQNEQIRVMSNVLLRRAVSKGNDSLWGNISADTQQLTKQQLLNLLNNEQNVAVRDKLCDTIGELGGMLIENDAWNELLETLFHLTKSENEHLRHSAFRIFSALAALAGEKLRQHLAVLSAVFAASLTDQSPKVAIAGLTAVSNFLQSLEPQEKVAFQQLIPSMLATISSALNANQQEEAREGLELFVDLAGLDAVFFKTNLELILQAMFSIATHSALEDSTRQMAIEFLVTLTESRPTMMRRVPKFTETLIPILLNLMLDLDDDAEWNTTSDEDEVEISNSDIGEEDLDRIALALGGKTVVPVLFNMISQLLANSDWKHRHTGLMAISVVGEGCSKQLQDNLDQILQTILPFLKDPHPRVRWATCHTLGQMSTDFGPELQEKFHAQVLPALIAEMDDVQNPRVQSHAAAAIINFCEHCDAETLAGYLDPLLTKLVALLNSGKVHVQEQAITAIAAVADAAKDKFNSYYDTLIPMLKTILFSANGKEFHMLRGKAIECISLIGVAVGKEKFAADAQQVMQVMLKTQESITEPDDPQTSFLLQSWARMCRCLGQDFVPYLQYVMPPVLKSASLSPDVTINANEGDYQEGWDFIPVGDKLIGIHTSSLEEKSTACNMLFCYAAELREGFFPYVEQVAKILVPLLKFYYHDGVRSAAASTMPYLLISASEALKKNAAQGADAKYLTELFHYMLPTLLEAVAEENDQEILQTMVETLAESISLLPEGALTEEKAKTIVDTTIGLFRDVFDRRNERITRKQEDDHDLEEEERIEDEDYHDDEILSALQETLGNTAKITRPFYLQLFQEYIPIFSDMLKPECKASDRQVALCVFDDLIDHIGKPAFPLVQTFFPMVMQYITDPDSTVRQAAVYGIGIAVARGGSDFSTVVPDIYNRLRSVITAADARSEDNVIATENAIAAAGRVIESGLVNAEQLLPEWLSWLPVLEDKVESKVTYNLLCNFVTNKSPIVFGKSFEGIPKVLQIFGSVLGTELVDDELSVKIVNILKQMQTGLPANLVQQGFASLAPEQQQKLQVVFQQ